MTQLISSSLLVCLGEKMEARGGIEQPIKVSQNLSIS
jgi:hypothetical protein